jgi:hypothetical protein
VFLSADITRDCKKTSALCLGVRAEIRLRATSKIHKTPQARELDKRLLHQNSFQFPEIRCTEGVIGFAVSSVYHFGHEEGTCPQVSPPIKRTVGPENLRLSH